MNRVNFAGRTIAELCVGGSVFSNTFNKIKFVFRKRKVIFLVKLLKY